MDPRWVGKSNPWSAARLGMCSPCSHSKAGAHKVAQLICWWILGSRLWHKQGGHSSHKGVWQWVQQGAGTGISPILGASEY